MTEETKDKDTALEKNIKKYPHASNIFAGNRSKNEPLSRSDKNFLASLNVRRKRL